MICCGKYLIVIDVNIICDICNSIKSELIFPGFENYICESKISPLSHYLSEFIERYFVPSSVLNRVNLPLPRIGRCYYKKELQLCCLLNIFFYKSEKSIPLKYFIFIFGLKINPKHF